MTTPLRPNASIENLKKQAKTLQKAWQEGAPTALQRIRAAHLRYSGASDAQLETRKPRLTDCQLVVARESGFDSWAQLKVAIDAARKELPGEFVSLACLCYDDPHFDHRSFHARAHQMLVENRWLAEAHIWSAAAAGNATSVRELLDEDPGRANQPGPFGWTPLLVACYSRVEPVDADHSTLEVARILLDSGADPNTYTMKGNMDQRLDQTARRFTALTGLFGGGSTGMANEPRHAHCREMAELLLSRGADPADEEAVAITQDPQGAYQKLEILLRHGLTPDARTRRANLGGITMMGLALCLAARNGNVECVRLLLDHQARTDEAFRGKTAWEHAVELGHREVSRLLEEAGAATGGLDEVEQFVSACVAGDELAARAMLARTPGLLARAPKELVMRAVDSGRQEAVRLVLDLGFDPDWVDECAPLHVAIGKSREIVRLLLERGASLTIREPFYDGTPVGWADFFNHREMRDWLLDTGPICLFDAIDHRRLDRIPDILARDPGAINRPFAKCLSRPPQSKDWHTPLKRAMDLGWTQGADFLRQHGASER